MFMGKHSHTVDSKGRMIIPAAFREELGESFVITRGLDACLTIYPQDRWAEMVGKLQRLSTTKKEVRQLVRFLLGGSNELECDRQGRVLIPVHLREYADIRRDAVVVGAGNQIEIWSKARLSAYEEESFETISDVAASIDLPLDFSL